jgi:DedD protein
MAFFKLRWPGRQASPDAGGKPDKPARRARAPQAESIEEMRRRARHRLMGAAVLVLAGVVGFPLLFDSQPRPVPVDVAISIPDRDKVAPLAFPQQAGAAADKAGKAGASDKADKGLADGEELISTPASTPAPQPAPAAPQAEPRAEPAPAQAPQPPRAQSKVEHKAAEPEHKAEPAPPARPAPQPESKPEPKRAVAADNGARARALLEGRTPAPAAAAAGERFIVQVGAFADDGKVQEVRSRLEKLGLKTYTQAIHTSDGKRTTRVRLGPFDSRADADKAAERAKSAGLAAAVLTL